jgi:hypothetical protein
MWMPSQAERRQSTRRAGSPERNGGTARSHRPRALATVRPWITVAAMRRAEDEARHGFRVRATPVACWRPDLVLVSASGCHELSDARHKLADDALHGLPSARAAKVTPCGA